MRVDDARRAVDVGVDRALGLQPRRQQPRRHAGLDPGAARDRRGRRRPGRGPARRRHPPRRRRGQGARARRPRGDDRARRTCGAWPPTARPASRTCSTSCASGIDSALLGLGARAESMPLRRMSSTFSTPAWPLAASPHRYGAADHHRAGAERERLDDVAAAPDAAVEQRPRSRRRRRRRSRAAPGSSPASRRGCCRRGWRPRSRSTPTSTARRASSTRMTPLSMNGPSHCSRSQRRRPSSAAASASTRRRRRRTSAARRRATAMFGHRQVREPPGLRPA